MSFVPPPTEADLLESERKNHKREIEALEDRIRRLERIARGEVPLGTWTKLGTCENDDYRCSLCDHISNMAKPYCPHCKGLMDMQNIRVIEDGYKDAMKTLKEVYAEMKEGENDNV